MAEAVYILCALTCFACAWLLARAYLRSRSRLLLWSSVCFACLVVSNVLLVVDLIVLPTQVDLRLARIVAAAIGLGLLLWSLIAHEEDR